MRAIIFGLSVLLLVAGCSSSPSLKGPAELEELDNEVFEPVELWSRNLGAMGVGRRLGLTPAYDQGRLYVANEEGVVYAIDSATGKDLWYVETESSLTGGPGVGDGLVVVGSADGEILALSVEDGAEQWRNRITGEALSAPSVAEGKVVVHGSDGTLTAFSTASGEPVWLFQHQIPVLSLRGIAAPLIKGERVYCGFAGGKLVAVELESGLEAWSVTVSSRSSGSELERLNDIDGQPIVTDGVVFISSYQGGSVAISEITGQVLWKQDLSSNVGLATDWIYLYASDSAGVVWALSADTGTPRWRQDALVRRSLTAPAVVGDFIVVGDVEGYLHWLDALDGKIIARNRVGGDPINRHLLVVSETLYVLGEGGELAAIKIPEVPGDLTDEKELR